MARMMGTVVVLGLCLWVSNGVAQAVPSAGSNSAVVWAIPDELYSNANGVNSGFLVDWLNAIQGITGISFTIVAHPELRYDSPNPDGTWNGTLIGAVSSAGGPDLVGTGLTLTTQAQAVVDFINPPLLSYTLVLVTNAAGVNNETQYLSIDDADLQLKLEDSNPAIFEKIDSTRPASIVLSDAAGIAKVASGNFAYVGESTFLTRPVAANAAIKIDPSQNFGPGSLSLAIRKGHPLESAINAAAATLAANGTLSQLLTKYDAN